MDDMDSKILEILWSELVPIRAQTVAHGQAELRRVDDLDSVERVAIIEDRKRLERCFRGNLKPASEAELCDLASRGLRGSRSTAFKNIAPGQMAKILSKAIKSVTS